MILSRPITENGHMVGVATTGDSGWLFTALDPRVEDLHGAQFRTPADAERVALLVLARGRGAAGGRA
ncbi:hypothetical protein GWK16_09705 [Roseomonas sp. JC162]|uniref:Uncharacterized protein n=1 Tax=Neoroseomonas marina TaxID=1232220 RepID=A0A848EDV2_9PROT|nr:hypothetical protein [Neoroseomonas marina]NMJ41515.1 hypothetical protein [Neoroseomonas marina]